MSKARRISILKSRNRALSSPAAVVFTFSWSFYIRNEAVSLPYIKMFFYNGQEKGWSTNPSSIFDAREHLTQRISSIKILNEKHKNRFAPGLKHF